MLGHHPPVTRLSDRLPLNRVLILTDVGDMRRLFGASSRIVSPRDPEGLAEAMASAMDDPRPEAEYEAVIPQVDIKSVAEQLRACLRT